jgi:hypothetical protein
MNEDASAMINANPAMQCRLSTLAHSLSPNADIHSHGSDVHLGQQPVPSLGLIRRALDLASQLYSKPSTEIHDGKYHI